MKKKAGAKVPMSKKRNQLALSSFKNAIRGSKEKFSGAMRIRASAPTSSLIELAEWCARSYGLHHPFRGLRGKIGWDLHAASPFDPVQLERELAWSIGLLAAHRQQLKKYIKARQLFEDVLLTSDKVKVLDALGELEAHCGISLWFLAVKIGTLQLFSGLEAQKEFVSEFRVSSSSPVAKFFAYWWSNRAEENVNPIRFVLELERRIQRWKVDQPMAAHLRFHLFNALPDDGYESYLLAQSGPDAAVDLYEAMISLITASAIFNRESKDVFSHYFDQLTKLFDDPRHIKVGFLLNKDGFLDRIPTRSIAADEVLLAGRTLPELRCECLEESAAAVQCADSSPPFCGPVWARIHGSLGGVQKPGDSLSRAQGELFRLGLVLSKLSLGNWCSAVAHQLTDANPVPGHAPALARYCATPFLEASALQHVSEELREKYLAALGNAYGNTLTEAWARLSAGYPATAPDVSEKLSRRIVRQGSLINNLRASKFVESLGLARDARTNEGELTPLGLRTEIVSLLNLGELREAVKTTVTIYLANPEILEWLPLNFLAEALDESDLRAMADMIETPILVHMLATNGIEAFGPIRSYAVEDLLTSIDKTKPSQIEIRDIGSKIALVKLLREVCVPSVLHLSTAYESQSEVEDERLAICRKLIGWDPDNKEGYEEELRNILRGREVRQAVADLQRSKIAIDEPGLLAWGRRYLAESFERYAAYLRAGVAVVNAGFREELLRALNTGSFEKLYDIPQNEASALFSQMVTTFVQECALNPEHGIDCYISLRIRHGTLSGLLRRPCDEQNLLTTRMPGSDDYHNNVYWTKSLVDVLDYSRSDQIGWRLAQFSEQYDVIIQSFADDIVQVKRDEKPNGLFDITLPAVWVYTLAAECKLETRLEEFLESCLSLFWVKVEGSLQQIRDHIRTKLADEFNNCLDKLESDLIEIAHQEAAVIVDAIKRARGDLTSAFDQMCGWFELPQPTITITFKLQQLAEVGLEMVRNFHRDFNPHVTVEDGGLPPLANLVLFSDIFFVLFENIFRHSGFLQPGVHISASVQKDDASKSLTIRVESDCRDSDQHAARVNAAKIKIESDQYLPHVRSEGGSGLLKLAKLIKRDQQTGSIDFGFDESTSTFFVEFSLPFAEFEMEDKREALAS